MKIVEEYLFDKRIKIINKENEGLSSARNRGIKEVTGEYILFVDSDDWLELNAIEVLLNFLKEEDIIGGHFFYYDELKKVKEKRKMKVNYMYSNKGEMLLNETSEVMVWNKLYKLDFLRKNKLKFLENIIHEDEEFTLKCYMKSPIVRYIEVPTYNYRINRENSIMNRLQDSRELEKSLLSFEKIIQQYEKMIVEEKNEFKKLRIFLKMYFLYVEEKTQAF